MKPALFLAALLLGASAGVAGDSPPDKYVIDDIAWSMNEPREPGRQPQLQLTSDHSNSTIALDGDVAGLRWEPSGNDGAAGFTLDREAGALACHGRRSGLVMSGTCRFTGSPAYEAALATRGVRLAHRRDLLSLALVDATTALVDDLAREGYPIRHEGDLMAVAALKVTGAYARELNGAGLRADGVHDLVACRALAVDGGFLRAMAAAGYASLTAREAISLRAVGVTPDYAETMNRVAGAVREVAAAGDMQ